MSRLSPAWLTQSDDKVLKTPPNTASARQHQVAQRSGLDQPNRAPARMRQVAVAVAQQKEAPRRQVQRGDHQGARCDRRLDHQARHHRQPGAGRDRTADRLVGGKLQHDAPAGGPCAES